MTYSWGTFAGRLAGAGMVAVLLAGTALAQVPRRSEEGQQPSPPVHDDHHVEPRTMSPQARPSTLDLKSFGSDPVYEERAYDPKAQFDIYGGKKEVPKVRPLLELGQPLYAEGPLNHSYNLIGRKNLVSPQLYVYGDWRTVAAFNDNGAKEVGQIATRLNLDVDLKLTATERVHALFRPLDRGGAFTRYEFAGQDRNRQDHFNRQTDLNLDTLFFEGDLGAIVAGVRDEFVSWDMPIAFGLMPLVYQNGIWVDDAFIGGAFTIPSRNSRTFDITNMDFTFFVGTDKVSTPAILDRAGKLDEAGANLYGVTTFIEALEGYIEAGYGRIDDTRSASNFSYNNATLAFTKRYGGLVSNSVRGIVNWGQNPDRSQRQTADGYVLLLENSLITHLPSTLVPYFNFFVGKDRPQSLARDAAAGGLLKNTGLSFETDGLTGFPKLDDTANDTYGGAIGVQYLFSLNQQVVLELATVQMLTQNRVGRAAQGPQYAISGRYQLPLTNAWIFRADVIAANLDKAPDVYGGRLELRRKF